MARIRMREIAEQKGWDINELFRRTKGISFSAVRSLWSNPNQNASMRTLLALSEALGVTIDELLDRTNEGKR